MCIINAHLMLITQSSYQPLISKQHTQSVYNSRNITLLNCAFQRIAFLGRIGHLLKGCILDRALELAAFGRDEGMAIKLGFEVVNSRGIHKIQVCS